MRLPALVVAVALVHCGGCAQSLALKEEAAPQNTDLATRFYKTFCANVYRDGEFASCDEFIHAPGALPGSSSPQILARMPSGATLVFIPGIFGECVAPLVTPFSDAYSELAGQGFRTLVLPVDGRSSSENNAREIDAFLRANLSPTERILVFGYSKGATDFLTALGMFPVAPWVKQTKAFVSVAGVIRGTPLADHYANLYDQLFTAAPFPTCAPGSGNALKSMTVVRREAWLATHHLPPQIRYYSVAAVAEERRINPLLAPFWYQLSADGFASDGQVAPQATRIPDGQELGILRGDHWSIALPFEDAGSVYATPFAINNSFPRRALIKSMISVIEGDASPP